MALLLVLVVFLISFCIDCCHYTYMPLGWDFFKIHLVKSEKGWGVSFSHLSGNPVLILCFEIDLDFIIHYSNYCILKILNGGISTVGWPFHGIDLPTLNLYFALPAIFCVRKKHWNCKKKKKKKKYEFTQFAMFWTQFYYFYKMSVCNFVLPYFCFAMPVLAQKLNDEIAWNFMFNCILTVNWCWLDFGAYCSRVSTVFQKFLFL